MNIYRIEHTSNDRTPFTYLIGWSALNLYYYGVRYKVGCHPSDLWVNYFTSSTYVKTTRSIYGDPDVVQIRNVFDDPLKARLHECKVNRRLTVKSPKFLNKFDGGSGWTTYGMVPCVEISSGVSVLVSRQEYQDGKGTLYRHHTTGLSKTSKQKQDKSGAMAGKVSCIENSSGARVYISRKEFYENADLYTSHTKGRTYTLSGDNLDRRRESTRDANIGFVPCFDVLANATARVTKEEFHSSDRFISFNSKRYKAICSSRNISQSSVDTESD